MKIKTIILLLLIISVLNFQFDRKEYKSSLSSSSITRSFSSSSFMKNGNSKPETHYRSMHTEEFRDKSGDKPEEIRKYGEIFKKDNDGPSILKKKAATNVEEEEMVLGKTAEEKVLSEDEETSMLGHFKTFKFPKFFQSEKKNIINNEDNEDSFSNFFGGMDKEFENSNNFINNSHGEYDNFLAHKAKNILDKSKSN